MQETVARLPAVANLRLMFIGNSDGDVALCICCSNSPVSHNTMLLPWSGAQFMATTGWGSGRGGGGGTGPACGIGPPDAPEHEPIQPIFPDLAKLTPFVPSGHNEGEGGSATAQRAMEREQRNLQLSDGWVQLLLHVSCVSRIYFPS